MYRSSLLRTSRAAPGESLVGSLRAPAEGWINHARGALGVSAAWLAGRLGVAQSSVALLEKRERHGTITLASLKRAADALDCDLVYALVPRRSIDEVRRNQAHRAAAAIVANVAHSMTLEDQAVTPERTAALTSELAEEMLSSRSRRIWDVPAEGA